MSIAERPIPDGRLEPAPDFLKDASPEEQRRWLVEQHKAKRRPPPLPEPVSPPAPEPAAVRPNGLQWTPQQEAESNRRDEERWQQDMVDLGHSSPPIFSAADLFASPQAVWHTMPNGARVAVHPVSVEEAIRLNACATADYKKLPANLTEEEKNLHAHYLPMAWQVVMCCRESLDPTSPRIFKPEHAQVLLRNPGWLETVQAIVTKSNQAGGEEKALREVLRGFFGATEHFLRTLLGELRTQSPPSSELLTRLEDFAGYASRLKLGGSLTESDVEAVRSL